MAMPLSGRTRGRFKRLTALFIFAHKQYPLPLGQVHAVRGAVKLSLATRNEPFSAPIALVEVPGLRSTLATIGRSGSKAAFPASLWFSAASTVSEDGLAAIAAAE